MNDDIWGLPGARVSPPLPGLESFTRTPLALLLQQAAARAPAAVALVGAEGGLDFATLHRQAMQVAAAVAALLPPGAPLACLLPQRPDGFAALLGALMSGRVCLVLNPREPAERLAALLADAAPAALLLGAPLAAAPALPRLLLDDILAGPPRDFTLDHPWNPDAPMAVHYTSGSSGLPKGIVLSARSVLARTLEGMTYLRLGPADAMMAASQPSTSPGVTHPLAALLAGGRAVLTNIAVDGASAFLRLAGREGVTCASCGPSLLRMMLHLESARAAFRQLRMMRIGNSAILTAELAAWRQVLPPGCEVQHTYASTEALAMAQWLVPQGLAEAGTVLAAGLAEATHRMALLDEAGHPVASGEAGELVLSGPLLALGEWQGGRLVPGRLVPEPGRPGWRRFHTGDLLRVQPDGLLRVVGRADRQVKINGVRVEPAEVEAVLLAEPGVTDATLVALARPTGTVLVGFVVAPGLEEAVLFAALRRRLAAALPAAFRPSRLHLLPVLPRMSAGGKLDRQALERLAAE